MAEIIYFVCITLILVLSNRYTCEKVARQVAFLVATTLVALTLRGVTGSRRPALQVFRYCQIAKLPVDFLTCREETFAMANNIIFYAVSKNVDLKSLNSYLEE